TRTVIGIVVKTVYRTSETVVNRSAKRTDPVHREVEVFVLCSGIKTHFKIRPRTVYYIFVFVSDLSVVVEVYKADITGLCIGHDNLAFRICVITHFFSTLEKSVGLQYIPHSNWLSSAGYCIALYAFVKAITEFYEFVFQCVKIYRSVKTEIVIDYMIVGGVEFKSFVFYRCSIGDGISSIITCRKEDREAEEYIFCSRNKVIGGDLEAVVKQT